MALLLMFLSYISFQRALTIQNTVFGINDIGKRMDMMDELKVRKALAIGSGTLGLLFMIIKLLKG